MTSSDPSSTCDNSSGNSFVTDSVSSTFWVHDETENEASRVIWQASQPQDPVLKQLMNDAYMPRKPSRIVQTKSWTTSLDSCTVRASSSTVTSSEQAAKPHRPFKRRSSNTNVLQTAAPSHSENNLDERVQKLVALLPIVSKQADENAKREQQALQRRRKKRKKAALLAGRSSVTKKNQNSARNKDKQREADNDYKEDEISIVEKSSADRKLSDRRYSQCSKTAGRPGPCHDMPPPSFVPLRKSWSSDGNFLPSEIQKHELRAPRSTKYWNSARELSFPSMTLAVTSPPRRPPEDFAFNETTLKGGEGRTTGQSLSANANDTSALASSRIMSGDAGPRALSQASLCMTTQGQPAKTRSKTNAPPVLGMRRLINSQCPILSQGRPLPVKQDKFKVPFAKPKAEHHSPAGVGNRLLPETSLRPVPLRRESQETMHDTTSSSYSAPIDNANSREKGDNPTELSAKRGSSTSAMNRGYSCISDGHSSSPSAEEEDSTDYDMDFDPEELERTCSMYD